MSKLPVGGRRASARSLFDKLWQEPWLFPAGHHAGPPGTG